LFLEKVDITIAAAGISLFKAGLTGLAAKSRIRCCAEKHFLFNRCAKTDITVHEVERNIEIIKLLCSQENIDNKMRLFYNEQHLQTAKQIFESLNIKQNSIIIGIHPGSNINLIAKRWHINNFVGLIKKIRNLLPTAVFFIFGGPDEKDINSKFSKEFDNQFVFNLTGIADIITTALLIKYCNLFVSNDSGLMHCAVAVNVKTIALFGPTIISKNRPYSDEAIVITKNLDCQPCYKYNQPISCNRNYECMSSITVEEVANKLLEFVKKINK